MSISLTVACASGISRAVTADPMARWPLVKALTKRATQVAIMCVVALAFIPAGCGEGQGSSVSDRGVDPTPTKLDGSSSDQFEQADIDQADSASPKVQAYCAGAVSEAQRVGCLSHVTEEDIP